MNVRSTTTSVGTTVRNSGALPSGTASHRWLALAGLSVMSFVLLLSDSALSIALPTVRTDLGLGMQGVQWIVNAYTLSFAAVVLLAGSLADAVGARRLCMLGVAVFSVASLLAGLSPGFIPLVAARLLQGVGAALITPATLSLIIRDFAPPRQAVALGIWAGASTAALGIGPLIGAAATEVLGWRWLFLLNVPIGVVALVAGALFLTPQVREHRGMRFDVGGALTSGIGLALVLFAVTSGTARGWTSPVILVTLSAGALSLAAFVAIERRSPSPMLDLSIFRRPNVVAANTVGLMSTMVMCGVLFFMSLYLQSVLDYSPLLAGVALLPLTVPLVVTAPIAGRLMRLFGRRVLIAAGLGILALGLIALSRTMALQNTGLMLLSLFAVGIGSGISVTPTTAAAVEAVPPRQSGLASGVLSTSRTIGLALGVSVMGALVAMGGPTAGTGIPSDYADGLSRGLLIYGLLAGATAVLAIVAVREKATSARVGAGKGDE
jgi:EmrB/QacA subfamily drug resistance transporter